ncbi:hypothetical protein TrST_g6057 [Triparma strigata]|uniref:Uncharacterized protein n=1 Tax=Triparma strigata TaxID=1606541 RepID=A0A9W7EGZ4_9STRA|nr:hypothetical protein TrST_g6057 [Triparma strigata]
MDSPAISSPESSYVESPSAGDAKRPAEGGTAERRRRGRSPSAKSKVTDISALTSSVFGDSDADDADADADADEESTNVASAIADSSEDESEVEILRRKPTKKSAGRGEKRGRGFLGDDDDDDEDEAEDEHIRAQLLFSRTWKLSVCRELSALGLTRGQILKSLKSSKQSKASNLSHTCTKSKLEYTEGEDEKKSVTDVVLIACIVKEKEKCAVLLGSLNGSLVCLSRGSGKYSKIILSCLKHLDSTFDPKPVKFSPYILTKATGIWSSNNNNSPITLTWGSSYVIKKAGLDDVSVTVGKDFFDSFKKHVEQPELVVEALEEWVAKEIGVNLKHFNLVKASSSHNLASSVGTCKIKKWNDLITLLPAAEVDNGDDTTENISVGMENRDPISTPEPKRRKAESITPPPSVGMIGTRREGSEVDTPDIVI